MKITFLELKKWEEEYLLDKLENTKDIEFNFISEPLSPTIIPKIKDADILVTFIYSKIDKKVIEQLKNLKFIATMSTGFDHIDLKECKDKNIKISNVPFYGENTVAEHTFALILSLSRKIPESLEQTRKYNFNLSKLKGFDLKGKTLGIVGLGHIGQHVARIANGFEMKVIAFDPYEDEKLAKELNAQYVTLNNLLGTSDIITLHAPYNEKTHHLINKNNIKYIKKGAYLINTARGKLIDTQALIRALDKNIIAGAGLDVLEEECFIKEEKELLSERFHEKCDYKKMLQGHYLIQDPRILVTPHNAFNSEEALERILNTTVKNITGFLNNKPINLVKN